MPPQPSVAAGPSRRLRVAATLALTFGAAALTLLLHPDPARLQALVAPGFYASLFAGDRPPAAAFLMSQGRFTPASGPHTGPLCTVGPPRVLAPPALQAELAGHVAGLCTFSNDAGRAEFTVEARAGADALHVTLRVEPPAAGQPAFVAWSQPLPGPTSLWPPLLAIGLALAFGRVLLALGLSIALGALLLADGDPAGAAVVALVDFFWPALANADTLYILGFTCTLLGMVAISMHSGGLSALVGSVARRGRSPRAAQLTTAVMGTLVFFDDYANTIVVGACARPLTDRHRVSREKLSYLVDATSAPVAGLAVISTWIGIEVSLLDSQLAHFPGAASGYEVFFAVVPFRFYCIFALVFLYLVAALGRDFGPMLQAERRARQTGAVLAPDARPLVTRGVSDAEPAPGRTARGYQGALPIVAVLLTVVIGFLYAGRDAVAAAGLSFDLLDFRVWQLAFTAGGAKSGPVLLASGVVGTLVAAALALAPRLLTLRRTVGAWLQGVRGMRLAIAVLLLALTIRHVTDALGTAPFLVALLHDLPPLWLPLLVFALAACISFATGTSWGTMGILMPVAIPLVAHQAQAAGAADAPLLLLLATSAVLDGAIFGDHCSPISDTTVLSSAASGADHLHHVRTQLPYAVAVMLVAASAGHLWLAATDLSVVTAYLLGVAAIVGILFALGRRP